MFKIWSFHVSSALKSDLNEVFSAKSVAKISARSRFGGPLGGGERLRSRRGVATGLADLKAIHFGRFRPVQPFGAKKKHRKTPKENKKVMGKKEEKR